MKNNLRLWGVLIILVAVQAAWPQVPQTMSYQGVLRESDGDLVADGSYSITFRLYDPANAQLWAETQPSVQVSKGIFSAILGSINPLNLPFDKQYYLGITVGPDPELTPRLPLTASPYCLSGARVGRLFGERQRLPYDDGGGGPAPAQVYRAQTDGFVTAWALVNAGDVQLILRGVTDGANSPTTVVAQDYARHGVQIDACTVSFPVKLGDYWKVEFEKDSTRRVDVYVYWMPIGN